MNNLKTKIGYIEFVKGGWSSTSENIFPKYFRSYWIVTIPILKSELKKGSYTTGICFHSECDAKIFSNFLKGYMMKYIKELEVKK